jgi:hypothetical protein
MAATPQKTSRQALLGLAIIALLAVKPTYQIRKLL